MPENSETQPLPNILGRFESASQLGWCLVVLSAVLVYLNSLPNDFTYDDLPIIVDNPVTQLEAPWYDSWQSSYWPEEQSSRDPRALYRPLTVFSYALQRRVMGSAPWSFHTLNVLLHALASLGVWWLAKRLGCSAPAALLGGLVFAVHPLHVEAVANIVGRAELLSTVAILLALWLWDLRLRLARRSVSQWRLWALRFAVLLLSAVAITSKESGAIVVVLVGAWYIWEGQSRIQRVGSGRSGNTFLWISWMKPVVPLLALLGIYVWFRVQVTGSILGFGEHYVSSSNLLPEADLTSRILTPFSLLGRYLGLMVWPDRLLCDYSPNVLPVTSSVIEGYFLIGVFFVIVSVVVALFSCRRGSVGLLIVLGFYLTYVAVSNSLVLIESIFGERWFYGPSVWLCVALGLIVDRAAILLKRKGVILSRSIVVGCVSVVLLWLSARTWLRNPVWKNNETLFSYDLAAMDPEHRSGHLCNAVGKIHYQRHEFDKAEALVQEAIRIEPDHFRYHQLLGKIFMASGRNEQAVQSLEQASQLQPMSTETLMLLEYARNSAQGVDLREELKEARQNAASAPQDIEAARRWAELAEIIDTEEALVSYRRLVELAPDDSSAWIGLGLTLGRLGEYDQSLTTFEHVLLRWPDSWAAHSNLAALQMDQGAQSRFQPVKAVYHARRAMELNPTHFQLRINLAEVLAHCNHEQEAADLFDELAKQSPSSSTQRRLFQERADFLRRK